ncbi:MAG: transporter substrate-binding domain-containing protein, partial [Pseudomonas bubulae]
MSRIHQTFESWMRIVLGMALLSLALPVMGASGTPFRLATRFVDIQPLQLDAPERQWLANHGTLRVGIAIGDYEPVDITDDRNNYQGISADYLSIVRDTLG